MLTSQIGMDVTHIKLVPYNPDWATIFDAEKKRLHHLLHSFEGIKINHIGSTSMPTVQKAKPIIDILVGVKDNELDLACRIVYEQGLLQKGDCERPYRFAFTPDRVIMKIYKSHNGKDYGIVRNNLHFTPSDSRIHEDLLLFKRYMCEHPDQAKQYFKLKERLVNDCNNNSGLYGFRKETFVRCINDKAREIYGFTD